VLADPRLRYDGFLAALRERREHAFVPPPKREALDPELKRRLEALG